MILKTPSPHPPHGVTSGHLPGGRHTYVNIFMACLQGDLLDYFLFTCTICHLKYKRCKIGATSNASSQGPSNAINMTGAQWVCTDDRWLLRCWESEWASSTPPFQIICNILSFFPFFEIVHISFLNTGYITLGLWQAAPCLPPLLWLEATQSHRSPQTLVLTPTFQKSKWSQTVSQIKLPFQKNGFGGTGSYSLIGIECIWDDEKF